MTRRVEKFSSWFIRYAGKFIAERLSLENGLIGVSAVELDSGLTKVKVFITVYPETKEKEALEKLQKSAPDFYDYIKKFYRMKKLPQFEFGIDYGKKKQEHIEKILNSRAS